MAEDPRIDALNNGNGSVEEDYGPTVEEVAENAAEKAATRVVEQMAIKGKPGRKPRAGNGQVPPQTVNRLFPTTGDEVVIKKRVGDYPSYKTVFVGQYNSQDVAASKTLEAFLQRYIVPKKGGGDYVVTLLSPGGNIKNEAVLSMEADEPVPAKLNTTNSEDKLLLELLDVLKVKKAQGERNEVLEGIRQQLGLGQQGQTTNAPNETRLILDKLDRLEKEKEDSTEKLILTKLLTRMDKENTPPQVPILPSMPPQQDVGQAVSSALEKVLDRFAQMHQNQQQNQMTLKDMLELMEKMKPPPLPPPVKEKSVFEQMMEFAQVKQTLFGDKDNQVELIKQQNENLKEELRDIKQTLKEPSDPLDQIKQVVELNDALEQLGKRRTGGDGLVPMIRDIFGGAASMAKETGKVLDKQRAIAQEQRKYLEQKQKTVQKQEQEQTKWPYPEAFRPYFDNVKNANDDLSRIKSTLEAFQYLGENVKTWAPYYEKALSLAKDDYKDDTIKYVRAFLNNLAKTNELSPVQISTIVTAFERNWESLRAHLFGEDMPKTEEETENTTEDETEAETDDHTKDSTEDPNYDDAA